MELTACRFKRRRNQLNPRSLYRGGPDAQDQTSHPTKEPQGQSPLGELRSAQSTATANSTAQPPVSHRSGSGFLTVVGLGVGSGGGGRPVTTVKDGSPKTQAVNHEKKSGSSRDRIPKESETLSQRLTTNLRSQRLPSQRLVSSQRFEGLQRSQSLQSQRLETNQGASRSFQTESETLQTHGRAAHLTQWAMLKRPKSRVFWWLQAQRGLLRQRSFFQPTGLRDLRKSRVWLEPTGQSEKQAARVVRGEASGPTRATPGRQGETVRRKAWSLPLGMELDSS